MTRLRATALAGFAAVLGAALWWRKHPSACPYGQRFWVEAPHPFITRERLREALNPRTGETILEVGPGTGYYTLPVATWLAPGGALHALDVQQEMLDHTMRRAHDGGVTNIVPRLGDAQSLPYEDEAFDGAYLVTVLGEVPDQDATLRELRRVLKPDGRLVVGELVRRPAHGDLDIASASRHGCRSALRASHWPSFRLLRGSAEESAVRLRGVIAFLAAVAAVGCGGDSSSSDPAADAEIPHAGPQHIHGLGINPADGSLSIATHTGLFTVAKDATAAERVGDSQQDTMGFTVVGPDRFLGSGHPDARESLPPLLGLIRSDDAGGTWRAVDRRNAGLLAWTSAGLVLIDGRGDVRGAADAERPVPADRRDRRPAFGPRLGW